MGHLIIWDEPRDGIVRLTLNRPDRRNALTRDLLSELDHQLRSAEDADVVVLRGKGKAFCAGADLTVGPEEHIDIGRAPAWERLRLGAVPVVAQIHGYAVTGGLLLALSCDLVVAARGTVLQDTHAHLGLVPTGVETQILPPIVGVHRARELLLTGRQLTAQEAQAWGLVNRVVSEAHLDDAALELAEDIAANHRGTVRAIRRAMNLRASIATGSGRPLEAQANDFGHANVRPDGDRRRRMSNFHDDA